MHLTSELLLLHHQTKDLTPSKAQEEQKRPNILWAEIQMLQRL